MQAAALPLRLPAAHCDDTMPIFDTGAAKQGGPSAAVTAGVFLISIIVVTISPSKNKPGI